MGILKTRKRRRVASTTPALSSDEDSYAFAATVPVGPAGLALWKLEVRIDNEPQADGDRLRVRAHVQANLASALRVALDGPEPAPAQAALAHEGAAGLARGLAERAGVTALRLARRTLNTPVLRRVAEPLLQLDFNTWFEVQASTASLHSGAQALLPQAERLAQLGIHPKPAGDTPRAETWAGEAPDGFAQVTVLQADRRHLPDALQRQLGDKPFGLAATVVNTVQKRGPTRR